MGSGELVWSSSSVHLPFLWFNGLGGTIYKQLSYSAALSQFNLPSYLYFLLQLQDGLIIDISASST